MERITAKHMHCSKHSRRRREKLRIDYFGTIVHILVQKRLGTASRSHVVEGAPKGARSRKQILGAQLDNSSSLSYPHKDDRQGRP